MRESFLGLRGTHLEPARVVGRSSHREGEEPRGAQHGCGQGVCVVLVGSVFCASLCRVLRLVSEALAKSEVKKEAPTNMAKW